MLLKKEKKKIRFNSFLFLLKIDSQVPIYARAQDLAHLLDLKKAGATEAILANAEVEL